MPRATRKRRRAVESSNTRQSKKKKLTPVEEETETVKEETEDEREEREARENAMQELEHAYIRVKYNREPKDPSKSPKFELNHKVSQRYVLGGRETILYGYIHFIEWLKPGKGQEGSYMYHLREHEDASVLPFKMLPTSPTDAYGDAGRSGRLNKCGYDVGDAVYATGVGYAKIGYIGKEDGPDGRQYLLCDGKTGKTFKKPDGSVWYWQDDFTGWYLP
ncbi:hypothetical protein EJ05DRAFT_307404 [Pseudovirgaria hyperparasitica]|uniref:Uncharacterized protein n=1 Tax=Pseudovirgaria hyperparasitica TaxID=470096 RepID=A0A6A6WCN3_9PEZI|nr:uncharacterized protein EJ05DRAFT_307404 [Pseudovirgaria hyperparasitica]KAF2759720.1 hypothetical protein EJ05DRAFT_307404 [Pseudovirgaria hyperparasitica]